MISNNGISLVKTTAIRSCLAASDDLELKDVLGYSSYVEKQLNQSA